MSGKDISSFRPEEICGNVFLVFVLKRIRDGVPDESVARCLCRQVRGGQADRNKMPFSDLLIDAYGFTAHGQERMRIRPFETCVELGLRFGEARFAESCICAAAGICHFFGFGHIQILDLDAEFHLVHQMLQGRTGFMPPHTADIFILILPCKIEHCPSPADPFGDHFVDARGFRLLAVV